MGEFDVLVVGAGLSGATCAEILARNGKRVLVVERRSHVAGNAYDPVSQWGVRFHKYGPHIFHTNSERVWLYLSRFTEWRPYTHRVVSHLGGRHWPIPVNLTTLRMFLGHDITPKQAAHWLASQQQEFGRIDNAEQAALARVGNVLYRMFFAGYTRKMWGCEPSLLSPQVTNRIPVRPDSTDDRYFTDTYQAIPANGYHAMVQRMLNGIRVERNTDGREWLGIAPMTIWTGPVDTYYGERFGPLPYRSLRFEHDHVKRSHTWNPSYATINEASEFIPYTRTTYLHHLTGQEGEYTMRTREFPTSEGDPYYPVPSPGTAVLYAKYAELAERDRAHIRFAGRLGTYRYYNMDQVVAQAMTVADSILLEDEHARDTANRTRRARSVAAPSA